MTSIGRFFSLLAFAALVPACALCSATIYTDRASWDAAVQAAGYNMVSVSFANPSAWQTSSYAVGTEAYIGLTSNQTSNGMSVTIDSAAFELLYTAISIQNNSLVDSERASQPEIDTSFSFGNPVYAFGGDYSLTCGLDPSYPCATSTFFLTQPGPLEVAGPNSSGFWGIVASSDAGSQQFLQGISGCEVYIQDCFFNFSLSNFDVAVVSTPEPSYLGLLTLLGAGIWVVTARRRLKAAAVTS